MRHGDDWLESHEKLCCRSELPCRYIIRPIRTMINHSTSPISTNLVLSYVAEHVLGLPRSY